MYGTTSISGHRAPRGPARPVTDYSQLLQSVQAAGLFQRRYGYYAVKLTLLAGVLAGVWVCFTVVGDSWVQLAVAAVLGVVLTQIMFTSHDAAHRQIFRSHRANEITALLMGTLVGGVSLAWWNTKHNKHHAAPNQIGKDPDIMPAVVQFYPPEKPPRSAVGRFLRERQGWWFFPLLLLEALNLHWQSLYAVITTPTLKRRRTELALLAVRWGGYPAVLFVFLSPGTAAAFLLVQLAVMGVYLGSSFAASHIGMPILPPDSRVDFLRRQVLMSRNVKGGRVASFAMGGLNYQIEHHLFPNMPRPSLRKVRPIVRQFCSDASISYHEVTITRAWALVAAYLNRVGPGARDPFQCPMVAAFRPR
jgi:fatty acid desaturase